MEKICVVGDSWAIMGYTEENYDTNYDSPLADDVRFTDGMNIQVTDCCKGGKGNLDIMRRCIKKVHPQLPLVWVFTEPGRDYGYFFGDEKQFDWISNYESFKRRNDIALQSLEIIQDTLPNPIAFIGGLADIPLSFQPKKNNIVLERSWQKFIFDSLGEWPNFEPIFNFGWGASDVGWRYHHNDVKPCPEVLKLWEEQILIWCRWGEKGMMCHEHPTPLAHKKLGEGIEARIKQWLKKVNIDDAS